MEPKFPRPDSLIRFFRNRRPVLVRDAAHLLGWPLPRVLSRARDDGVVLSDDCLPWEDVAFWLIAAWPRDAVVAALERAATRLPTELCLRPVTWRLPRYVVTAMERQARLQRAGCEDAHDRSVQGYVADVLHLSIESVTVDALREDRSFMSAYRYPEEDE